MIWRELTNHADDCYFCVVKTFRYNAKNKYKIVYPNVSSAILPVPHSNELPQPVFHEFPSDDVFQEWFHSIMLVQYERPEGENKYMEHLIENSSDSDDTVNDTDFDEIFTISSTSSVAHPECVDQSEINNLVHILGL